MIDIAVIAGLPYLDRLSAAGTIDMALTHLVLRHPAYAAYFRERATSGITVILDNSAYELETSTGAGMSAEPVLTAAHQISARIVVCQDILFDGPATITATRQFLADARRYHNSGGDQPVCQFMGVPQGTTRSEWLDCYRRLVDMPGIDVIGLSKLSVPACFDAPVAEARLACVADILADAPKPLHLLGGDQSLPWELSEHRRRGHDQAEPGAVRSNDSSFAYWYAARRIPVDPLTGRAEQLAPAKPDLENTCLDDAQVAAALDHIAILRHAAGVRFPAPDTPDAERRPADGKATPCR